MEENKIYTITYKNQSLRTKHYKQISDDYREKIKTDFYKLPSEAESKNNLDCVFYRNGVKIDKYTRFYFHSLMTEVQCTDAKWTVKDVFDNNELLGLFISKVENSPKTFDFEKPMWKNIERSIALGGKGYVRMPTQFPLKSADYILKKYNFNNNYFDFSCGWGSRLLSSFKNNVNYYGVDPNFKLVEKLKEATNFIKENYNKDNIVDIRCQGSEILIPEYINKFGLAFSSPPYYDLEDYKYGEQSFKGQSYEEWKNNYLFKTFVNVKQYLVNNGYLVISIKDIKNYPIATDSLNFLENNDFKLIESFPIKNNKRIKSTGELNTKEELIYVFRKE